MVKNCQWRSLRIFVTRDLQFWHHACGKSITPFPAMQAAGITHYCLVSLMWMKIGSNTTWFAAQLIACLRDLARHFKTDLTDTVAFCLGIPENTVFSSQLILCQPAK
jgi:hypothetical protein